LNRTPQKAQNLGFKSMTTPNALWERCDTVLMYLFESNIAESVLEGETGLLNGVKNGKTLIDLTTNHFDSVLKLHEAVAKSGGAYLEAPVLVVLYQQPKVKQQWWHLEMKKHSIHVSRF